MSEARYNSKKGGKHQDIPSSSKISEGGSRSIKLKALEVEG